MYIGSQRARIEIWRNNKVGTDEFGGDINEPVHWKSTWAQMSARRGNEHLQESEVFALTYWLFTCRYLSVKGVKPTDWIVHDGQAYDIRNIMPDENRKDHCVIEARIRNINMQPGTDEGGALEITLTTEFETAYVGEFYMGGIPEASGGDENYTLSAVGALPDGMSIDPNTGIVSGTPTTVGTTTFGIKVVDGAGAEGELIGLEIEVDTY